METNPKYILDDINNRIRNRDIFKYNREFLIQSLILAINKLQYISLMTTQNLNYVDQVIEQYRAILKFIYSVDNDNGTIPKDNTYVIEEFMNMIMEFVDSYTPIRNYLDQCIIGTRKIESGDNNEFWEKNYDSYSNYSRLIDKVKTFPSEELKNKVLSEVGKYLSLNKFKKNNFRDNFFMSLMEDYKKICWLDSEIKFDFDFGNFKYEELISFCASLKLMADFYSYWLMKKGIFSIDYESMVYSISKLASLSKEKVKFFLKYQTYDYQYQKDKLTLIQGLLLINNKFYFFPMSINLGLLPVKMYRLIYDYDKVKYRKEISKIAKEKELQMTNEIVKRIEKYNITIKTNYRLFKNNQPVAEYDMLAFDNKNNDLYICEFKWHFIGDGESEHKFIDDLLEEEIIHRKEKDKFLLENPKEVCNELFGTDSINSFKEILISQNFSGNTKHSMPVIDFETLQWSVERFASFKELMDYFITDKYRESIPVNIRNQVFNIEGYKFNIYQMCPKENNDL